MQKHFVYTAQNCFQQKSGSRWNRFPSQQRDRWKETDVCETCSWSDPRNWKPIGLNSADSKHLWRELPVLCACLQTDHPLEAPPHAYAWCHCQPCSVWESPAGWSPETVGANAPSLPVSLSRVVLGTDLFCFHSLQSCDDILSHFWGEFNCQSTRYSIR